MYRSAYYRLRQIPPIYYTVNDTVSGRQCHTGVRRIDNPGRRILYCLQLLKQVVGDVVQHRLAVVRHSCLMRPGLLQLGAMCVLVVQ